MSRERGADGLQGEVRDERREGRSDSRRWRLRRGEQQQGRGRRRGRGEGEARKAREGAVEGPTSTSFPSPPPPLSPPLPSSSTLSPRIASTSPSLPLLSASALRCSHRFHRALLRSPALSLNGSCRSSPSHLTCPAPHRLPHVVAPLPPLSLQTASPACRAPPLPSPSSASSASSPSPRGLRQVCPTRTLTCPSLPDSQLTHRCPSSHSLCVAAVSPTSRFPFPSLLHLRRLLLPAEPHPGAADRPRSLRAVGRLLAQPGHLHPADGAGPGHRSDTPHPRAVLLRVG